MFSKTQKLTVQEECLARLPTVKAAIKVDVETIDADKRMDYLTERLALAEVTRDMCARELVKMTRVAQDLATRLGLTL